MLQSIEGVIDQNGQLKILENVDLPKSRRIIITILDEELLEDSVNLALLSEAVLAQDWNRPEEEEAWSHLDRLPSL